MKQFLQNIVLALFVFGTIWISAETILSHIDIKNDYTYKYRHVENNPSIKTLLIGNSHFENSINPYLMGDSLFDFAISGRWIYWDVKLAERLYATMPNLKTVVFPHGYAMPYGSMHFRNKDSDKEYAYNYSKYMHVYYDIFPDNLIFCSALIRNKMGPKYWIDEGIDSLGYGELIAQEHNFENKNVNPDMLSNDTSLWCYAEYCTYLKELAKVCYDNNIRFVAVTCPCADSYLRNTTAQGIQNLYSLIDSVRAYYPIEYYNYLDDADFRADSIYYNCSHLNSIGADRFAVRLKHDLGL